MSSTLGHTPHYDLPPYRVRPEAYEIWRLHTRGSLPHLLGYMNLTDEQTDGVPCNTHADGQCLLNTRRPFCHNNDTLNSHKDCDSSSVTMGEKLGLSSVPTVAHPPSQCDISDETVSDNVLISSTHSADQQVVDDGLLMSGATADECVRGAKFVTLDTPIEAVEQQQAVADRVTSRQSAVTSYSSPPPPRFNHCDSPSDLSSHCLGSAVAQPDAVLVGSAGCEAVTRHTTADAGTEVTRHTTADAGTEVTRHTTADAGTEVTRHITADAGTEVTRHTTADAGTEVRHATIAYAPCDRGSTRDCVTSQSMVVDRQTDIPLKSASQTALQPVTEHLCGESTSKLRQRIKTTIADLYSVCPRAELSGGRSYRSRKFICSYSPSLAEQTNTHLLGSKSPCARDIFPRVSSRRSIWRSCDRIRVNNSQPITTELCRNGRVHSPELNYLNRDKRFSQNMSNRDNRFSQNMSNRDNRFSQNMSNRTCTQSPASTTSSKNFLRHNMQHTDATRNRLSKSQSNHPIRSCSLPPSSSHTTARFSHNTGADTVNGVDDRRCQHRPGVVPRYLIKRRHRWATEEAERLRTAPDPNCPAGHRLVPQSERESTLAALQSKRDTLIEELNRLPIAMLSRRHMDRKRDIEEQLRQTEDSIQVFSRPTIYVRCH